MEYTAEQRVDEPSTTLTAMDRRTAPRRKTRFKATIIHGPERTTTSCVVRNLSDTGACLKLDDPTAIPAEFYLIWLADRAVLKAEAVWRSKGELGVRFLSKHDIQGRLTSELAAICRAWELRDAKK
jgi:hypothetical protein